MKKRFLIGLISVFCILGFVKVKPIVETTIQRDILHYKDYVETDFNDPNFFRCLYDVVTKKKNESYTGAKLTDAQLAAITTTGEYCKDRGITSIDGAGKDKLTKLVTLDLSNEDDDDSNDNKISTINTSSLIALTTLNLKGVGLTSYNGNNNASTITTLNLNNNRLNSTGYISRDTDSKLVSLELSNNSPSARLTNLDLSKDTALRTIKIIGNDNITDIKLPSEMTGTKAEINISITNNTSLANLTMPDKITTTNNGTTAYYAPTVVISGNGAASSKTVITMPTEINSGGAKPIIRVVNNSQLEELIMPSITTTQASTAEVTISDNDNLKTIDASNTGVPIFTISNNKKLQKIDMKDAILTSTAVTYTIDNNGANGLLSELDLPKTFVTDAAFTLNIRNNNVNSFVFPSIIKNSKAADVNINIEDNKKLDNVTIFGTYTSGTEQKAYTSIIEQTGKSKIVIKNNTSDSENSSLRVPYSSGEMELEIDNNKFKAINLEIAHGDASIDGSTPDRSGEGYPTNVLYPEGYAAAVIGHGSSAHTKTLLVKNNSNLTELVLPTLPGKDATFTINDNYALKSFEMPIMATNLKLDARNNALTSIGTEIGCDVSELYLDNGDEKRNKLTSLDLSFCNSLVKLNVSNNDLTTLMVNGAKLTELKASNNKLAELDLSSATVLDTLDVSKNLLTSVTLPNPSTKTLKHLYLQDNKLTTSGIVNLGDNTAILTLNLSDNDLNSTCLDSENNNAYENGVCPSDKTETTIQLAAGMTSFTLDNNRGDLKTIKIPASSKLNTLEIKNNNSLVTVKDLGNTGANMKNLIISNNKNLSSDLDIPSAAASATADLSKNSLKTINIKGSNSVNNFINVNLSDNKINTINNLAYWTKLTTLDLHNNDMQELTVNNAALTNLNIEEKNNFKHQIAMYVGESVDVTTKNPVIITKPAGKTITLKENGLTTDNTEVKISGNNVSSDKVGDYTSAARYTHSINEDNNTFKVVNDIHVVSIEGKNERYETITAGGNQYLYIRNYNATDDANAKIVENLKVNGSSEYISISTPTTSNNKTTMKVTEVGGDGRALPTFTVVGLQSTDTSKYVIEENGILVFNAEFDASKVKLAATTSGFSLALNDAKTELTIKNGDIEVKKLQVINVNSTDYSSYLTKQYVYDNEFNLSKLSLVNGTTEITYKANCGTEKEKCEILNIKNQSGKVVKAYDVVRMTSDKYEITNKYIIGLNEEFSLSNINPRTGTLSLNDVGNELIIKYGDETVDTLDIGIVKAPYDLKHDFIVTLKSDYDNIGYRLDDLFVTEKKAVAELNDAGNQITIKVNNKTAKTFNLVKPASINLGDDFELLKGKTRQLKPILNGNSNYEITNDVEYVSSNNNVATVSSSGLVTAVSPGTVTITASTKDSNVSDRITSNPITVTVANSIKITYKSDGEVFKEEIYSEGSKIDLATKEKTGYTLKGYNDGTITYNINEKYTVPTSDVVLNAVWEITKHNLTVDLVGGSTTQSFESSYTYNTTITLVEPTKTGYSFAGWDITGAVLTNNTFKIGTSDVALTAKWVANKYTVTYENNGGTSLESTKQVTYGSRYGTLETPTKTGYNFAGWFKEPECTNEITGNTVVNIASNHKLYAKWTAKTYTVTFKAPGGTVFGLSGTYVVSYGGTYENLPTAKSSNSSMNFVGWFTEQTGGTEITNGSPVTISKDHELYARFADTTNYKTVTYHSNGGTDCEPKKVQEGKKIGAMCIPTKEGNKFDGWYKEQTFITKVDEDTIINSDTNLYAKWIYIPKFTINMNGGSTTQTFEERYNSGTEITLITPRKDNATFKGWTVNSDSGSILQGNKLIIGNKDVILTAEFTSNTINLSYNPSTGCTNKSLILNNNYGELCEPPVKTNYVFTGWYTAEFGGTLVTSNTKVTNNSNHTLYARYEALEDRVNSNTNYRLSENQISNITQNTNIETNFGFQNDVTTRVYTSNGELKTSGIVFTGDVIKAYQNNKEIGSYKVIVKGDVTGNGMVKVADVARLYQFNKGKITLDEEFIKAGDVVKDNNIGINDVAKLYQFVKGKVKEL